MPVPPSEAEFWSIYAETLPVVYGFLVRRTDVTIAEDLTQDVFTTAARTFARGQGTKISLPWLLTVARSRMVDHFRAERRRTRNLALAWSGRPKRAAVSAEDSSEAERLAPVTEQALASLPTAQRAALILHHVDDLSVVDVARCVGRSVRATESLLARARRSFRTAFEEAGR